MIGAELDLTLRPVTGLRISVGGTMVDSKIKNPAIVASPFAPITVDATGDPLPYTPKWQGQADIEYGFDLSGSTRAYVGASSTFRSKSYAVLGATLGPAGTEDLFKIKGYALLDLRAGIEIDDRYKIQVFGKNVLDKAYWNNVTHIYDTVVRFYGQPVTYGVTLSAGF